MNTFGSFSCRCNKGFYGNGYYCVRGQCSDSMCPEGEVTMQCVSPSTVECECRDGFAYNEMNSCVDINECELTNGCGINEKCRNTVGAYECDCTQGSSRPEGTTKPCSCNLGYTTNSAGKCVDIDECSSVNFCHEEATCSNSAGNYSCKCKSGFFGDGLYCDNQRVLVLNSFDGWQPAVFITSSGEQERLGCFEVDAELSSALLSCSVSWKNQFHIFGGAISENKARQISRLEGKKLVNIGSLSFDHQFGACSTIGDTIYLCFNSMEKWSFSKSMEMRATNEFKRCRRATSPTGAYVEIVLSNYDHMQTETSASESKLDYN